MEGAEGRAGNGDCGVPDGRCGSGTSAVLHAAPDCLTLVHDYPLLVRLLWVSALERFPRTGMKAEPIT